MNVIVILCDTLRRDHCSPYTGGLPLNLCWSREAPDWKVPTPNMDRLARRGTVFENAWCGSTPCMPARRDLYTGRYEFLERGWGPLEEEDLDLPRQVSGAPNRSLAQVAATGDHISHLITDHFHLWEQGSGNYHMGYSGVDFIRGHEADAYRTDPVEFFCPGPDRNGKVERHWRNVHFLRRDVLRAPTEAEEGAWFAPQVFSRAGQWLDQNAGGEEFYLHLDCFDPHEPLDPPEELVKLFDPRGYDIPEDWIGSAPYAPWRDSMCASQLLSYRARYAAKVVLVDRWLGKLLDAMDRNHLWDNTLLVFTTDHGTFNGDHGRLGKLQTHQFDAVGHIPFVVCHPQHGHGERRPQLVQLVDIYPTVLAALGKPVPLERHGINLLPVLQNGEAPTRQYAIAGQFGKSVTLTDGEWVLHQSPVPENQPLHWHGHCLSRFLPYDLGPWQDGYRSCTTDSWPEETWLSHLPSDPNELVNRAHEEPEQLAQMQRALGNVLQKVSAPPEQALRLGLASA